VQKVSAAVASGTMPDALDLSLDLLLLLSRQGVFLPLDDLYDSIGRAQGGWFASGAFNAAYEVDIWGRIRRSIEASRADTQAAADAENVVRITVAAETARAYADACAFAEQADTARQSADIARQVLDLTTRQRDLGAKSDFDVASAAAVLDQTRATIPTFEGERRAQLFELAVLTGRPPSEISQAAAACTSPPTITAPLPVGDGAALLKRRPDVLQAERTLAGDTARIGVAVADFEFLAQAVEKRAGERGGSRRSRTRKHGGTHHGRDDLAATIFDVRSKTGCRVSRYH